MRDSLTSASTQTFTFLPPSLTLTNSQFPTSGGTATIVGQNLGSGASLASILINGATVSATFRNDTSFTVTIPAGTGTNSGSGYTISFQRSSYYAPSTVTYFYLPPSIVNISSSVLAYQGVLTINGQNFGPTGSQPSISLTNTVNGIVYTCAFQSYQIPHTQITCSVGAGQGVNLLVKVTVNGQSSSDNIRFAYPPPTITSWSTTPSSRPTSALVSGNPVSLTVNGANFGFTGTAESVTLTIGGVSCTVSTWTSSQVVCPLPAGEGMNLPVVLTIATQSATASTLFTYDSPSLSSLSPVSGTTLGVSVQLVGVSLGTGPPKTNYSVYVGQGCKTFDNTDSIVIVVGGWATKTTSTASGSFTGTNYFQDTTSGANSSWYVQYTPNLAFSGNYSVSAVFVGASVLYDITTSSGLQQVSAVGSATSWTTVSLGSFLFDYASANLRVRATSGQQVTADAITFCPNDPLSLVPGSYLPHNHTAMTFSMPPGVGSPINVMMTIGSSGGIQSSNTLSTFNYNAPNISAIGGCTPSGNMATLCQIDGSQSITITGSGFGSNQNLVLVYLKDRTFPCTIQQINDSTIVCGLPVFPAGGQPNVFVMAGGQVTSKQYLKFEGPVITSGTLSRCDGVLGNSISLANNDAGSLICFQGTDLGTTATTQVTYGVLNSAPQFPCSIIFANSTFVKCNSTAGLGHNLVLTVVVGQLDPVSGTDTINYLMPLIQGGTIRNLPSSPLNGSVYVPDGIRGSYQVTFDVKNLPWAQSQWAYVSVTFGKKLPPDSSWRPCSQVQIYSMNNPSFLYIPPGNDPSVVAVSCNIATGFGEGFMFRVSALNVYSDPSNDTFSYPDYGLVLFNVSGCDSSGISTTNCPTLGGTVLTLQGINFCDFVTTACALTIEIGSQLCTNIVYWNSTKVTCVLPPGSGPNVGITIIQDTTFATMDPVPTISYAIPSVTSIRGCSVNSATSTSGCPSTGSTPLTIFGSNFGASGALVFVGNQACTPVVHDVSQTFITCPLPKGFGSNVALTLYDSFGRKCVNTSVTVSYQPCSAGSSLDLTAYTCNQCAAGTYTDVAGSFSCKQCPPGRYTNNSGLSTCSLCMPGTFADDYGYTNCTQCQPGTYQQGIGQVACSPCSPGFYSNASGSSSCSACPSGWISSSASLSCSLCLAGTYAFGGQCLPCPAGTYSSSNGSTSCSSCAAGSYSQGNVAQCSPCTSGSVAKTTGMLQCQPCAIGYYANASNPTSCLPCPAGYVTTSTGQTNCTACGTGFFINLPGQPACLPCPQGRFQNASGSTQCQTCYPGTFNPNTTGSAQCSKCAVGYYIDGNEASECLGCSSGYFTNVTGAVSCTACPTGKYQDNSYQSLCLDCPTGRANSLTGQAQCQQCLGGAIANTTGLISCLQCPAGSSQSSATLCTVCTAGLYQPSDGQQSCLQCAAGRYSAQGATTCIACAAGNFSSSRGSTSCSSCPTGQYTPSAGSSDCLPCAVGYNSSSTSSTSCAACPPGYYQDSPGSSVCFDCKVGYFNPYYASASCTSCTRGYYANVTTQTSCTGCLPGFINTLPAAKSCTACDIGRYTSIVGQQECTDCAGGRFSDRTGTSSCSLCGIGSYSSSGATICNLCTQGSASGSPGIPDQCPTCSPGFFSTDEGATSCKSCPLGRYSLNTPTTCLSCPSGAYAAVNGTAICPLCAVGFYQLYNMQSQCIPCDAGRVAKNTGAITCTDCLPGTYVSTEGQFVCAQCPPGKWGNSTRATSCNACDAGYYSGQGFTHCVGCPPGTTSDAKRQKCDECSPGFFNNETASLMCYGCAAGFSQSQPASNSCDPCPPGKSSVSQAINCDVCPTGLVAINYGTVTPCSQCRIGQPNIDHTACECGVGEYASYDSATGSTRCNDCAIGASCESAGVTWETLQTAPGYWRANTNSTVFYRCLLIDQCAGGRNSTCDAYRTGPLCALCVDGATQDSTQKCVACQAQKGASIAQVFFIILAIIIALIAMYAILLWSDRALVQMVIAYDTVEIQKLKELEDLRRVYGHKTVEIHQEAMSTDDPAGDNINKQRKTKTEHSDVEYRPIGKPNITYKLKIVLSFFQIATNLTFALNIPWPRLFTKFVSAFNFINLDFIQWSTVGCVAKIDYYLELILITILPVVTVVAMVTFYLAPFFLIVRGQDLESRAARSRHLKKVWKLVLFSMFLVYPKVSSTVLNLFVCRQIAGTYYLVADLSLECYTGRWSKYLPYDVLMIIAYPIGIPLFFLYLLLRNKPQFHLPGIRLQLGFLYDGFDSNTWWFELADMLHKLLLTSVLAFFPDGAQMPIGMTIAIVHLCVIIIGRPYYRKGDDRLHMFAQVELFLLMLAGFVCYKGNGLDDRSDVIMSLFLIAVLTGFLSVFLIQAGNIVKKQCQKFGEKRQRKTTEAQDLYLDVSASGLAPPSVSEHLDDSTSAPRTRRRGPSESISIAGQVSGVKFLKAWTKARRQENKAQIRRKGAKTLADIQEATDDAHMERNPMWGLNRESGSSEINSYRPDSPSRSSHHESSTTQFSDVGLQEVTLAPDVIAALQAVSPIPFHYEAEVSPSEEKRPLVASSSPEPETPNATPDSSPAIQRSDLDIKETTDFPPTLESAILEGPPQNIRKSASATPRLKPVTPREGVKTPKESGKIASATPTLASVSKFFATQTRKSSTKGTAAEQILLPLEPILPPHLELPSDAGGQTPPSMDMSLRSIDSDSSPPSSLATLDARKSTQS